MIKTNLLRYNSLALCLLLSGCASMDGETTVKANEIPNTVTVAGSYLEKGPSSKVDLKQESGELDGSEKARFDAAERIELKSLAAQAMQQEAKKNLADSLSDEPNLRLSVEGMPLSEFTHHVFGELLGLNYILDSSIKKPNAPVTLNLAEGISPKRLYLLTAEILATNGNQVLENNGVFYIHPESKERYKNVVVSIGASIDTVPNTTSEVLQLVPLKYGVKIATERTIRQLFDVKIIADPDQNTLYIQGKRNNVIGAMEIVSLLDVPANRGKYINLQQFTFISATDFVTEVVPLLEAEGIPVSTKSSDKESLLLLPIAQLGALAIFSNDELTANRVSYWASLLDKPAKGEAERYFVYHPNYARAADLGESISALIGVSGSASKSSAKSSDNSVSTGKAPARNRASGAASDTMRMVVDERANSILFYTSGTEYQKLLPLIDELDVLPRQVMLDITIAEVLLTDEFKYGVEWALTKGEVTASTAGAFGVTGFGGLALNLDGSLGSVDANFLQTNSLAKVLSNPTLLVRDGVSATISIGTQISVRGATTTDSVSGDREIVASEYKDTGVKVTVTPSVNAQNIVIMEIEQSISNTLNTTGAGDNPNIFERNLSTEVVAASGNTVLLAGLVSEDVTKGGSSAPGLSSIPLLGNLFKGEENSSSRTELVMLITPRIIETTHEWEELRGAFESGLRHLELTDKSQK